MLPEPLEHLLSLVDPGGCHVTNLPSRIWVFGGPIEVDRSKPTRSLRDSFWRQTLELASSERWLADLDRPEAHDGWWAFSGYTDLLSFERDACYLSKAVILFAESPGSLAELGALAIDDALLPKLLVAVQSKFLTGDERESFLNLGPLRRVETSGYRCVISTDDTCSLGVDDFDVVVEAVSSWLPNTPHKTVFHPQNPTHQLLLLADLVDILLVTKVADLKAAAAYFNVVWSDEELLRALNLLDFFGLVKKEYRGKEPFFVRKIRSSAPWIDYTGKGTVKFDRARFKVDIEKSIQSDARRRAMFSRAQ
ncbi:retron St85 family effector protein [Burkholderia stagnalis]|uniref:retron St85 family effector protein n=1 Tax=Burkholderia stagnalis TaxID=1503054 RepID=UPI00163A6D03|nr:retron St85 family effector protein [Burkholderia stagnalis]